MLKFLETQKDLPNDKLLALFRAVGWTTEDGTIQHAQHFNTPFCGSSHVVSAWDGETLVGCARVLSDGAVRSVLYDIAVLPTYHGQGIGGELLMRCMQKYPKTEWIAETTAPCIVFYETYGFEVAAIGEDCVFMRRPCPLFN